MDEIAESEHYLNIIERDGQKSRQIHQDKPTERSSQQQTDVGFKRFQNKRRQAAIKCGQRLEQPDS